MAARDKSARSSPPRPLMPRMPATTTSLRSSPAPRLAAPINRSSPSSTTPGSRPLSTTSASQLQDADTATTPVKAIAANITPRSSARKSKIGSANSTPTQDDTQERSTFSPNQYRASKLGPSGGVSSPRLAVSEKPESDVNRRDYDVVSNGSFSPSVRPPLSSRSLATSPLPERPSEYGPSFFRAEDRPSQDQPRRPAMQSKTSSFMYADGRRETGYVESPSQRVQDIDQSSQSSYQTNGGLNGFFQSNTVRSQGSQSKAPSSTGAASPGGFAAIAVRSPSPTKLDYHLSYRKGASQVIRPPPPPPAPTISELPSSQSTTDSHRRQSSLDTVPEPPTQDRRTSTSSLTSSTVNARRLSASGYPPSQPKVPSATYPPPTPQTRPRNPSLSLPLQSPSSPSPTSPPPIPDTTATAHARHERKVLDLEISNSSLLAINRSLEREVRRQKTELRRLRRVTRNNARTSWLSDSTSVSSGKGNLGSLDELAHKDGGDGMLASSLDEYPNSDDEEEELEESDIASTTLSRSSDGTTSPTTRATRDARHLQHDQQRLQLDLTSHRELLVDSQRMNVSIKRCQGLVEMMVREGGRALVGGVVVDVDGPHLPKVLSNVDGEGVGFDGEAGGEVDGDGELEVEVDEGIREKEAFDYFDRNSLDSLGLEGAETPDLEEAVDVLAMLERENVMSGSPPGNIDERALTKRDASAVEAGWFDL